MGCYGVPTPTGLHASASLLPPGVPRGRSHECGAAPREEIPCAAEHRMPRARWRHLRAVAARKEGQAAALLRSRAIQRVLRKPKIEYFFRTPVHQNGMMMKTTSSRAPSK
mmetsp:Transcript_65121/g.209936  ORF Transcript_65121/g.209936 Transcript_65121/m.209936 type:complete len:110 (-) Transcript_65121:74-403(-)